MTSKVCAIVMASGHAKRFGGDKLAATVGGISLIERCLDAVAEGKFDAVAVVARDEKILGLARARGFVAVKNDDVTDDTAKTIRLGIEAVGKDAVGAALFVSDQPFFASAGALKAAFLSAPGKILAAAHGGVRGNPVVFPADLFGALTALPPGGRGKDVINCHKDRLSLCEVTEWELFDVDTEEDLERANQTAPEREKIPHQ